MTGVAELPFHTRTIPPHLQLLSHTGERRADNLFPGMEQRVPKGQEACHYKATASLSSALQARRLIRGSSSYETVIPNTHWNAQQEAKFQVIGTSL